MEEQNQYYTPKITDIRVGYEFECMEDSNISGDGLLIENWEKCFVTDNEDFGGLREALKEGNIRTKYLTIEDVVLLGWIDDGQVTTIESVVTEKPINLRRFSKGRYWMIYDFVARVLMVAISIGDVHSVCIQRYDCPSVNELSYILSALNLQ